MAEVIADVQDVTIADVDVKPEFYYICKASMFGFDMHTKSGKLIEFRGFEHVTSSEEVAQYLAQCIKDRIEPLLSLKKVTKEELDPLYEMKQKIIAEHLKSMEDSVHKARDGVAEIPKQSGIAYSSDVANKTTAQDNINAALASSKKVQS